MRRNRAVLLAALLAITPVLAACGSFDLDKLDVFGLNEKKKLPGERKAMFPEGVPGVQQGVPKEYMQGYQEKQQQEEAARAAEAAAAAEQAAKTAALEAEKKKAKARKPRTITLRGQPTQITVQPGQQQQPQAQQRMQQGPWDQGQQPQQPSR